jgi:hypothetical protein
MADEKTYRRPSLDYSMSNSFMESYGKALTPTWQRGKKSMASGVSDAITGALGRAYTSYEAGRAITAAQEGKWEDATTREAWNTKEQYEAFIKLEKDGKDAYLEAVRTGDKEEQAKLLAEQAERKSGLTGWGESATLAIDNHSNVGWASSDRVYSPVDRHMVGEVTQNRNVTYKMEDGQMQIGIDYSKIYADETLKTQLGIPDPLPAHPDPEENGRLMTEKEWLADNGYELGDDGKLTRYVTKGQFDKVVTGAIAPTVMADNLTSELNNIQATGATEEGYFNFNDVSLRFQRNINKENLKTLMHEKVVGYPDGKSWADEYFTDAKQKEIWNELHPVPSGSDPVEFGDANRDGTVTTEELAAAKEYILNALEEDKNFQIISEELGTWWAGKAQMRFDAGKASIVEATTNAVGASSAAGGNQAGGPIVGNNRANNQK